MDEVKMTVYLAGPIADCTDAECKDWRDAIKKEIPEINFLDPMRRDYRAPGDDQEFFMDIVEKDKEDIDNSDVVLVYHDRPSVGTSMEILYAFERGKYIVTVGATGKPLSPWIMYHSSKIVKNMKVAMEELKEISSQYTTYEVEAWDDM